MQEINQIRMWIEFVVAAWRSRRSETGGVSDDVAMIAMMLGVAVVAGGIIVGLVRGAANEISFVP